VLYDGTWPSILRCYH